MNISTYAPLPKPKPITGIGDAKQLSSSFTSPVVTKQPNNGSNFFYSNPISENGAWNTPVEQTPTTKKPPATTPSTKTTPTTTSTQSIYDLSTDPIVQKIRSLNTSNYGQSVADADAQRKQDLIDAGFADIARATQFGSLETPTTGDEATALAAQANPFSIAAQLALAHAQALQGIDQTAAQNNTYFGSAHANQIGNEGRTYLGNVSSAEGQLRQALSQILSGLVSTRGQEQQAEADAISQARENAIQNALASGETFAGYDANGNPIFTTPGQPDSSQSAAPTPVAGIGGPSPDARDNAGESYPNQGLPAAPPPAPPTNAQTLIANALKNRQTKLTAMFG